MGKTLPRIKSIPIDTDGRYVILANNLPREAATVMFEAIGKWWNSGELFLLLYGEPGIELQLERIEHRRRGLLARLLDKVRGSNAD